MSPKTRFQVMLEPDQLDKLRRIEQEQDVPVARQIRRAIDRWLEEQGDKSKSERKRAGTRKRS